MSVATVSSRSSIAMLDAFESVGMVQLDILWISFAIYDDKGKPVRGGEKIGCEYRKTPAQARRLLPALIVECDQRRESIILSHPKCRAGLMFLQLDDLNEEQLSRVASIAFLKAETSPQRFQAWVAFESRGEETDKAFRSRVKCGLGADLSATEGGIRFSGTRNYKSKYPGFPLVRTVNITPGLIVTCEEIERLGIVGDAEPKVKKPVFKPDRSIALRPVTRIGTHWPNYGRCHQGQDDASAADFAWCCLAFGWGWGYSEEDVADELMRLIPEERLSKKGGWNYCLRTATTAYQEGRWDRVGWDRHTRSRKAPGGPPSLAKDEPLAPILASPPGISSAKPSSPRQSKAKIIALAESEDEACAIELASGVTTVAVGRGIPSDLRVRCGLGRVLMLVSDRLAKRLEGILWGKTVRVRLPDGFRSPTEMESEALRKIIFQAATEVG